MYTMREGMKRRTLRIDLSNLRDPTASQFVSNWWSGIGRWIRQNCKGKNEKKKNERFWKILATFGKAPCCYPAYGFEKVWIKKVQNDAMISEGALGMLGQCYLLHAVVSLGEIFIKRGHNWFSNMPENQLNVFGAIGL